MASNASMEIPDGCIIPQGFTIKHRSWKPSLRLRWLIISPVHEDETQRAAKQQKTGQTWQRGLERGDNQPPEPQAWLPALMINGEPLRDYASIRDFHGGAECHVASALEEALLLPTDMAELRSIRKNEVFLNLKRYLGMV